MQVDILKPMKILWFHRFKDKIPYVSERDSTNITLVDTSASRTVLALGMHQILVNDTYYYYLDTNTGNCFTPCPIKGLIDSNHKVINSQKEHRAYMVLRSDGEVYNIFKLKENADVIMKRYSTEGFKLVELKGEEQ